MKRNTATSGPRFLTAALLALAACAAGAPAARASCGDYVTVTNPAVPNARSGYKPWHQPPVKPEQVTPCSRHVPGEPAAPCQLPCQGPGCSSMPLPAPPPASTAGVGTGQDHSDCLLTLLVCAHADLSTLQPDRSSGRPVRRGLSVYHPPRPF